MHFFSFIQRMRKLTTPWRDRRGSVNGVVTESAQIRLTSTKSGDEV